MGALGKEKKLRKYSMNNRLIHKSNNCFKNGRPNLKVWAENLTSYLIWVFSEISVSSVVKSSSFLEVLQ
jgi:hypothetical protein